MEKQKRYAENYEIIHSFGIGKYELVIGEDPENKEYPYMTAFFERGDIIGTYFDIEQSADYAETVELFGKRIAEQAAEIRKEKTLSAVGTVDNKVITANDCKLISWEEDINGKIIVINPSVLKREYCMATHQLKLCTGGFGASGKSRGSAVYCTDLYSGEKTRYERTDVLGTLEPSQLPEWAKRNFEGLKKKQRNADSREAR